MINCAGIYGPKGEFEKLSWNKWKQVIEINLLGSIYLIKEILPYFKNKKKVKLFNLLVEGQRLHFHILLHILLQKLLL